MQKITILDDIDNKIIDIVKGEPGVRFSDVLRELNVPPSTAYGRIMRLRRLGKLKINKGVQSLEVYHVGGPTNDRE